MRLQYIHFSHFTFILSVHRGRPRTRMAGIRRSPMTHRTLVSSFGRHKGPSAARWVLVIQDPIVNTSCRVGECRSNI